jgi:hypothetical protein
LFLPPPGIATFLEFCGEQTRFLQAGGARIRI